VSGSRLATSVEAEPTVLVNNVCSPSARMEVNRLLRGTVTYSAPLSPHHEVAAFRVYQVSEESFQEWEKPPNINITHHLIFNSVGGLLHRWPNTLRRNGVLDPSSLGVPLLPPLPACSDAYQLRPSHFFHFWVTPRCLLLSP